MRTFNFLVLFVFLSPTFAFADDLLFQKTFPEFANLNINAHVEKKSSKALSALENEEDRYYLSIELGPLSLQQFQLLKAQYGSLSQVEYQKEQTYNLVDFLPPSIQAVVNQTFTPIDYSFEPLYDTEEYDYLLETDSGIDLWALRKNGLMTQTNCWNTTFENLNAILFNKTNYRLYLPSRWNANDEVDSSSLLVDESDIQTWDMLVIRENSYALAGTSMLMHTAIFLNKNVVFEKTDSTDKDPYRLSLVRDVLDKYKRIFGDQLVVEYRRVTQPLIADQPYISDPIIKKIINRYHPDVETNTIVMGCETGLGGGCDVYLSALVSTEVIIHPKTKRGILNGPRRILDQFSPLN